MIGVFLADPHVVFREGLARLLEDEADMYLLGHGGDRTALMEGMDALRPDVCLLELAMPGRGGLELLRTLCGQFPTTAVVVLSGCSEERYAVRCVRAGARGYLSKASPAAAVFDAVRRVSRGSTVLNPALTHDLALAMLTDAGDEPHSLLTDRESLVFSRLVSGSSVTDIARELRVSVKTVSTQKQRLQRKLRCTGVAELVRYAIEHGLAGDY